jgi:D-3-phosphoglycerate dehydrogenase
MKPKVLVKEKIADAGVELLREDFDVEIGTEMSDEELAERIGEFDAIVIRSATKMTAELIEKGERLRAIGRAGTGVDNVDMPAATKRGIIVANAPESNSIAAAEHTLALALALFRNVPQAHASLTDGRWERSRFGGNELYGKTLGVIGFGRIGQLVARRAQSFDMNVVGFDKFVAPERFRELGVEGVEDSDELYARADLITIHLPKTPETINWIDAEAIAKMRDGVRIVNCARGELIDLDALEAGLESGKVGGAALDVFPEEPMTEHPIFAREDVVVTPHLGASTAEAQDRAGVVTAEQVRAALNGGVVTNAVNIPAVRPETMEALAPFVPLCEKLGRLATGLAGGVSGRIDAEFHGPIAEHDTRILGLSVLVGALSGHTEEPVNLVNASAMAEDRGFEVSETKETSSEEFTELIVVRVGGQHADAKGEPLEVAGTGVGPKNLPHLVRVWGQSVYVPLSEHLAMFRYADQPGMIGRVGSAFGEHGVNIVSAAVGAEARPDEAVMVLTTDAAVPTEVVEEIARFDGFFEGRAVDL